MGFLSPWHWAVILVVAVLLFGNRLPEIARSLGRSVNEFKRGLREVKDNFDEELHKEPPPERLQAPPHSERLDQSTTSTEAAEHEPAPTETHKEG